MFGVGSKYIKLTSTKKEETKNEIHEGNNNKEEHRENDFGSKYINQTTKEKKDGVGLGIRNRRVLQLMTSKRNTRN